MRETRYLERYEEKNEKSGNIEMKLKNFRMNEEKETFFRKMGAFKIKGKEVTIMKQITK